ncbi:MAG: T9SS type A sorting domain-containing protein, partial [Flavobacteriales bacterium]|nr:T9SS type A sorting domain-containing protein [Flavobacteriales bacterium]
NLQVDSVKNANGALPFSYDGNILRVELDEVPVVGDAYETMVYYQGSPYQDPVWGGFYFESQYIYNLGIGLSTIPPNFGKVWYPCFDSFVERATYTYHIMSSGTYKAWCQGDFIDEVVIGADTVVRSFEFNQDIPTHLSAIAVANYQETSYVHIGANGDVPVTLRSKPVDQAGMALQFQDLGTCIDALEYWYGPHPFSRVGYVLTTDGALEIPTNIAYPQFMMGQSSLANEGLYSHELGHHWWGDIVTPHIHNDMWLKEGPAEYSSHLFVEALHGQEAFDETLKDNLLYVLENAHLNDGGFQPLSPMPDEFIYGDHTYYKGAAVMHNLRGYLGDDLFKQGMTAVQANHAYEDVTPEQFMMALEDATGYDLQPFFEGQIYSPGFATFVVDSFHSTPVGDGWNVNVFIRQKLRACPIFHEEVPLDLTVMGADWDFEDFQVVASGEFSQVNISTTVDPSFITLNRYQRLNQNRMDYEFVIHPGDFFFPSLPWCDFRLYDEVVVDSILFRCEHVWSAPDDAVTGPGIFEMSDSHYWILDGIWSDNNDIQGRIYYHAVDATELDFTLFGATEADAVMVWRETAADPWQVYPDFTLETGNLFNGTGNIHLDVMRKGQYAFANGDQSVLIQAPDTEMEEIALFPNPAHDAINISIPDANGDIVLTEIYSLTGKLLLKSSSASGITKRINIADFTPGQYIVQLKTISGKKLGVKKFVVD